MPLQTAVNSRLRHRVGSPFTASFLSFAIGTLVLLLAGLAVLRWSGFFGALGLALEAPAWQWMGGVLGVVLLTTNILAFARLGGVETALWPILGSVGASIAVDAFAWFGAEYRAVTLLRGFGALLVLLGVVFASRFSFSRRRTPASSLDTSGAKWLWRILAFVAGMGGAIQGAANGALGRAVSSPFVAAFISFGTGMLVIGAVALFLARSRSSSGASDNVASASDDAAATSALRSRGPWWMWLGGVFGAIFVVVMSFIIPKIGVGPANVATLLGLSASSLCVDHFGLFEAPKKGVLPIQILGIFCVFLGMVGVQFG